MKVSEDGKWIAIIRRWTSNFATDWENQWQKCCRCFEQFMVKKWCCTLKMS